MTIRALEQSSATKTPTPVRVLILEHARHDVELLIFELKNSGFDVGYRVVQNREGFLRALEEESFDAILADYRLPDWTGLDAFAEVKDSGRDIPFLLVSGTLGEEAAVECIKQGVSDYVLKDHMTRLPLALQRAIEERALREDLRRSEARNRDLVANSIYGICRASIDGNFLDVNAALVAMLGMDSANDLSELNLVRDVFRF